MVIQRSISSSALLSTPKAKNKSTPAKIAESPQDQSFQDHFCPWVRGAPNFTASGHMSNVYKVGLQRLSQHLIDNPEDILPTWSSVELGNLKSGGADNDAWNRTVCNITRLPKYWLAKFLSEVDPSTEPFTPATLKAIDDHDTSAIPRLFTFFVQLPESTVLPKTMRGSKLICWKVFQKRMVSVGQPIVDFAKKYVNRQTGAIDWTQGGCYTFQWDEAGNATSATYLGQLEVPVSIPVSRDYELVNPWDVASAMICKKPSKILCCEFFTDGSGPHAFIDKKAKHLERIAEEVSSEIEVTVNDLKREEAAPDEAEFVGEHLKEERTRRLHEAQSRARESAKRRRRVAIT